MDVRRPVRRPRQRDRLFGSTQFDYQAKRALGHACYQGALPGEVLSALARIREGDGESWFRAWSGLAATTETLAAAATDSHSRGNAWLRTSNYHRAGEFFLPVDDPRRLEAYRRAVAAFQQALVELGIPHRVTSVRFDGAPMRTYLFPGEAAKPLVVIVAGFDSITEEGWFWAGAALVERGYPVAMFDGPGQAGMLREQGVRFTPHWHGPLGAVLDAVEDEPPEITGCGTVALGYSLGGILATRAAAVDRRVGGLVLDGSPWSLVDSALLQTGVLRRPVTALHRAGRHRLVDIGATLLAAGDPGLRWGLDWGRYSVGGDTPSEFLERASAYTLDDVHQAVRCPVLILGGDDDIYVAHDEVRFQAAFPHAAGVTHHRFRRQDGAAEHCAAGAVERAAVEVVGWLERRAPDRHEVDEVGSGGSASTVRGRPPSPLSAGRRGRKLTGSS